MTQPEAVPGQISASRKLGIPVMACLSLPGDRLTCRRELALQGRAIKRAPARLFNYLAQNKLLLASTKVIHFRYATSDALPCSNI
jgi:hypothetical protein